MKSKWLISVGLVVCLVAAFSLPMCAPAPPVEEEAPPVEEEKPPVEEEAPPVEEELASYITAYASTTPSVNEGLAELIKEKMGIDYRFEFHSCGELRAKFLAEAPNFNADIGVLVCAPETILAVENGWIEPYHSPVLETRTPREWGDISPDIVLDPDDNWIHSDAWSFVLVWHPESLDKLGYEVPTSWYDLLDPKWEGKIVMPSPMTSGTAFMMLFSFMALTGGEEEAWEFYNELDKNIHHYTRSGNGPTDLVARGEFPVGITCDENILIRLREGYPFKWLVPDEGTGYDCHYHFIFKGCKELYTAQKMMDFLASDDYSSYMASLGFVVGLPGAPSRYGEAPPEYIPGIDHTWAIANKGRLCSEWKDRYMIGRAEPT